MLSEICSDFKRIRNMLLFRMHHCNASVFRGEIDTATAAGKAFLDMLGVFAEFETNLRKERQMEGIERAKANGVDKGRPLL